jgi:hypothetical protein
MTRSKFQSTLRERTAGAEAGADVMISLFDGEKCDDAQSKPMAPTPARHAARQDAVAEYLLKSP